ncbi:MAG: hypothetical protein LBO76_02935 [Treponema sp.]|jgi:hypothetical protein|nr:hypothetical protein [Treponema sp.]
MCIHTPKRAILWTGVFILFAACNQLDTVLPSVGTYRVNALVNRSSLDECSVIAAGDTVLPYFANSVAGDPDLANLVVYLEDSGGNQAGYRVRYSTEPAASTGLEAPPKVANPAESGDAGSGGAGPGKAESGSAGDGETGLDTTGSGAAESGAKTGSGKAGPGAKTAADQAEAVEDPSFAGGLLIPVDSFTGQLPPFPLAGDIKIGRYTMVFEIRGKQNLLSRVERQILYTGSQEFTSGGIRYYLPGLYGNKHLAPQGLSVMLETQVDYGEDLEPYIVWYNGSRRIGEGYVTGGTARLLWKAAQQTGFHTIRAELFPFKPQSAVKGLVKELSLPVSAGAGGDSSIQSDDFLYYYQLAGDLRETGTGAELGRASGKQAAWSPAEQIYGLALKGGDAYEALPRALDFSAISSEGKAGRLRFFVRFFPLDGGTILSAILGSRTDSVAVRLSLAENALYLELEGGGRKLRGDPLELGGARNSFVGVVLDVEIRETGIRASFELADSPLPPNSPRPVADPRSDLPPEAGEPEAIPAGQETADTPFLELELDKLPQGELRSWLGDAEPQTAVSQNAESRAAESRIADRETTDRGSRTAESRIAESRTAESRTAEPAGVEPQGAGEAAPKNPADPVGGASALSPVAAPSSSLAVAVVDDFSALFRVIEPEDVPQAPREDPPALPETALGEVPADGAGSQTR